MAINFLLMINMFFGWSNNYDESMSRAYHTQSMVLMYFHVNNIDLNQDPLYKTLNSEPIKTLIQNYVLITIPISTIHNINGKNIKLIDHYAYSELLGKPGLVIADFKNRDSKYYGEVISIYHYDYSIESLISLFNLPYGSLTQRTLIFAIRTHREGPRSTDSQWSEFLMN